MGQQNLSNLLMFWFFLLLVFGYPILKSGQLEDFFVEWSYQTTIIYFVVILIFACGVVQIHLEDGIVHFFYPFRFFKRRYNVNLNDIESVEYTYYQAGSLIFNFKYGDKKQSYGFLFVSNLAIRNLLNGINARIGGQQ